MKGFSRIRQRVKEKMFRPAFRLFEYSHLMKQQQKEILDKIFFNNSEDEEENDILESPHSLESYINEQIFAMGEEEDVNELMERFHNDKFQLFERRKCKGIENYLIGVQSYLNIMNDGEEMRCEVISRL